MSQPYMVNCLQESIKASFCESDETVRVAYSDLITSSKETLDSILELQEVQLLCQTSNKKEKKCCWMLLFHFYIYLLASLHKLPNKQL